MSDEQHDAPVTVWVETRPFHHTSRQFYPVRDNLIYVSYVCVLCGYFNDYWDIPENPPWCQGCHNNGNPIQPIKAGDKIRVRTKGIPSWRLNMDDATSDEVLDGSPDDFGMPYMSKEKWEDFYDQPHEKKKMREFKEAKEKEKQEILNSLGSPNNQDTMS